MSNTIFKIEQGFRQASALSADLYKVYINPLLNILSSTGLGGKLGNINCCAPTCADDVPFCSGFCVSIILRSPLMLTIFSIILEKVEVTVTPL
jgi:hypothetical protein